MPPRASRTSSAYEAVKFDRETLVSEALKQRPEYKQARLQAEAAEATVRQTFRDFFPNLFGVTSVGAGRSDVDSRGSILNPNGNSTLESKDWQIGLELRWNIFDGGNKIARYRETKALLEAAQAGVRDTELQVWQQVEQSHVNVVESEERIGAAQKAVESAQENFRLSQGRFDAGVGHHHRADRRPARADPGPGHRGAGALRLQDLDRPARALSRAPLARASAGEYPVNMGAWGYVSPI